MFTGLIEEKGKFIRVESAAAGLRLTVEARAVSGDLRIGDSVAVNGVCLTAVELAPPIIAFDVVRETVERSTHGRLKPGDSVNLERSLRVGDRLDGHMVLGHVDGIGIIREIKKASGDTVFRIEAQPDVLRLVVGKGSIAIDGISLTIAETGSNWFTIAVIPHTLAMTTLSEKSVGSAVNLETDIIGKYVFKYVGKSYVESDQRLLEKLSEGGFME